MFNDQVYNGVSSLIPPTPIEGAGSITVGSSDPGYFDLGNHCITHLEYLSGKKVTLQSEQFANSGVHYNIHEGAYGIIIGGYIKGTSRLDVLAKVDTLKANVVGQKKYLRINDSGISRRCRAVLIQEPKFSERRTDITVQEFTLTFETYDYMEDVTPIDTTATFSAPYTFNMARSGTAEAKLILTLNFTSATGVTSLTVNIAGSIITISTPIATGNVIVLDGESQIVTKNGIQIGYTGSIPRLKSANNSITITPNGTYSVSMLAQYRPAYK